MSRSTSELTHLFRAMKAPAAARALPNLAERAREEEWSDERFAEALLSTELCSRESSGGRLRIRAARFPAHKTLEGFDFTFQRSVKTQVIEHLGQLNFLHAKQNVILLGPSEHVSHSLLVRVIGWRDGARRARSGCWIAPVAPHRVPNRTAPDRERVIEQLGRLRITAAEIAECLGMSLSTVSAVLKRIGLDKRSRLDPTDPPSRYQHQRSSELVHLDVKKLGWIRGAGHRITAERSSRRKTTIEGRRVGAVPAPPYPRARPGPSQCSGVIIAWRMSIGGAGS